MESKQNRTMEKRESVMVKGTNQGDFLILAQDVISEQWALLGAGFKPKRARFCKPNSALVRPLKCIWGGWIGG